MSGFSVVMAYLIAFTAVITLFKLIRIVPEREAFIVEEFGKYRKTLGSGMHLLVPFIQQVPYKHILKEQVIDVEPQMCITKDNVQVIVDGILYLQVVDPEKASYGIDNYRYATAQLAKTTMRSEIGKMELDKSFSERDLLNNAIVRAVDEASDPWGIKVTRYEIKDISPTPTIEEAMQQQMRAERQKRAEILLSEGEKESRINVSKGEKEYSINISKGERQRRINVSEGKAKAMEIIANATAEGIKEISSALSLPKGKTAMSLRLTQQYIEQLSAILETADTQILPFDIAQFKSLIQSVMPSMKISGIKAVSPDQNTRKGGN